MVQMLGANFDLFVLMTFCPVKSESHVKLEIFLVVKSFQVVDVAGG